MEVDAGFPADAREHFIDGVWRLGRREDPCMGCSDRDGTPVIEEIKCVGIPPVCRPDFIGALHLGLSLGNERDELTGGGRRLKDACRPEGESLGGG